MLPKFMYALGMRTLRASPSGDPGHFGFMLAAFVFVGPIHTCIRACIQIVRPEALLMLDAPVWHHSSPIFLVSAALTVLSTWVFLEARSSSIASEFQWVPVFHSQFARIPVTAGGSSLALTLMYLSYQRLLVAVSGTALLLTASEMVIRLVKRRIEPEKAR